MLGLCLGLGLDLRPQNSGLGLGLGLSLDTDGLVNVTARLQDFLDNGLLLICFQFWTCAVMFFKTKSDQCRQDQCRPKVVLRRLQTKIKTRGQQHWTCVRLYCSRGLEQGHDIKTAESESGKHGLGNHMRLL